MRIQPCVTMQRTFSLLICAISLLLMPSCVYFGVNAKPVPAPGTVVSWPKSAFSEVRAYCYDYTAEESPSFFVNGRMHKGVMDPKGVVLSAEQSKRLVEALTVSQGKQDRTPCYKPHHAFVFYGVDGKVAAIFEMCFGCNKFIETPDGLPEYVDTGALYALCQELKLPLGTGNQFYTDACNAGRKGR